MFCPKCNSEIQDKSVLCPVCGCSFSEKPFPISDNISAGKTGKYKVHSASAEKAKKKANIPAIILADLLLVSVSVLIFSFSENSKLREENAFHLDTIKDKESKIGLLERSVDAKAKEIGDLKEQTYADAKEKSILSEKVEYSASLMKALSSEEKWGYATENFHVDKGVMVIDRFGGMQELKLFSTYYTTFTFEVSDTNVCIAKWSDEDWINKDTTVYITPVSAGYSIITFTNDLYDTSFKVLVIVE